MTSNPDRVDHAIREFNEFGFCVLHEQFPASLVESCREAFWPRLLAYLASSPTPNRGPHRHFLPMPFDLPCFAPQFFFDSAVLGIVRGLMDDRIVADQWGCDVPVRGSEYQQPHLDYRRPLFPESPHLPLPTYAIVTSFALNRITRDNGPIEIAPSTHRLARADAIRVVESGEIALHPVEMELGDVLIRHPWAIHRGTPNSSGLPRALISIRYVRRWYADDSRDVESIPQAVWNLLSPEQQVMMRFPVAP